MPPPRRGCLVWSWCRGTVSSPTLVTSYPSQSYPPIANAPPPLFFLARSRDLDSMQTQALSRLSPPSPTPGDFIPLPIIPPRPGPSVSLYPYTRVSPNFCDFLQRLLVGLEKVGLFKPKPTHHNQRQPAAIPACTPCQQPPHAQAPTQVREPRNPACWGICSPQPASSGTAARAPASPARQFLLLLLRARCQLTPPPRPTIVWPPCATRALSSKASRAAVRSECLASELPASWSGQGCGGSGGGTAPSRAPASNFP